MAYKKTNNVVIFLFEKNKTTKSGIIFRHILKRLTIFGGEFENDLQRDGA